MIQQPTSVVRSLTGLQLPTAADWADNRRLSECVMSDMTNIAKTIGETTHFLLVEKADKELQLSGREPGILAASRKVASPSVPQVFAGRESLVEE